MELAGGGVRGPLPHLARIIGSKTAMESATPVDVDGKEEEKLWGRAVMRKVLPSSDLLRGGNIDTLQGFICNLYFAVKSLSCSFENGSKFSSNSQQDSNFFIGLNFVVFFFLKQEKDLYL